MNTELSVLQGSSDDQVRLMVRVARAYHEHGMRQVDIADAFHISQSRVSRMLKEAVRAGIVRTSVVLPPGQQIDIEEKLEQAYGLQQAVVVDVDGDVTQALGAAAAQYLSATLTGGDTIGISSWSASLVATVRSMTPFRSRVADVVVQLVGGVGNPQVQMQATQLIAQLADRTGADPVLLPTPAVLGGAEARVALLADTAVAEVIDQWSRLTLALVGIGALEPSELVKQSGNSFSAQDLADLESAGAVGDVCFRFFDRHGDLVSATVDERVIGISPERLRAVGRRVGVAGGVRKATAIRGALVGGWVNALVTDLATAERLLELVDDA